MSKTIKSVDHFGNAVETRVATLEQEVILDIKLSYGAGRYACTNIPFEQAREIAYAILEATGPAPEPAPLRFEDLAVGEKFSIGDPLTRVKISDEEYMIFNYRGSSSTVFPKSYVSGCKLERVQ